MTIRYKDAGVDLDAGDAAVQAIKEHVKSTFGPHVVTNLGGFAGLSQVPGGDPDLLLVASMDGVGTKLKIACMLEKYDTVGQDLVNHCVGDIGVVGAKPLFFLDYIGTGSMDPEVIQEIVKGVSIACKESNCALLGGETAEMPGVYQPPDFDLVGTMIGTVRRENFVNGSDIAEGDVLIGFQSSGLQTNGYSLARKVLLEANPVNLSDQVPGTTETVGEALLAVHRNYSKVFDAVAPFMKGAAHITGGGLPGNVNRILPGKVSAEIDVTTWRVPPIFKLIADRGQVPLDDQYRAFNMGIGLVVVVSPENADEVLEKAGEGVVIGKIVSGDGSVVLEGVSA